MRFGVINETTGNESLYDVNDNKRLESFFFYHNWELFISKLKSLMVL